MKFRTKLIEGNIGDFMQSSGNENLLKLAYFVNNSKEYILRYIIFSGDNRSHCLAEINAENISINTCKNGLSYCFLIRINSPDAPFTLTYPFCKLYIYKSKRILNKDIELKNKDIVINCIRKQAEKLLSYCMYR